MKKSYLFLLILFLGPIFGCSNNNISNDNQKESGILMIESGAINQTESEDKLKLENENFNEIITAMNDGINTIPSNGITYINDEYGFKLTLGKEWANGNIKEQNEKIIISMPSPWRPGTFEHIVNIRVYTYEEYEQARQNQMDPECLMCSLEEFDKAIVGKNNKYYFLLGRSNRSDDELKTIFPSLECREETDSSVYGTYTYIYCDGIEYINGEPKKTGKNWIEQILPTESFSFFDI